MIITRSPLRITLGGGGTDLPSYYRKYGGIVLAAAIDKYVYVTVTRPFIPGIFLKYSKLEHVEESSNVQHPIIREAIRMLEFRTPQIEITTLADIPAGTGLGSSGSFTTALLKALYLHRRRLLEPRELARLSCELEIDKLMEPVGKQDQYISAFGGLTCFQFHCDESVDVERINMSIETMYDLEDNLLLFFTGFSRKAGGVLSDQETRTKHEDEFMLRNLHRVKELGLMSLKLLESGRTREFGDLLNEQWMQKRQRSDGMSNDRINEWYELARRSGAIGGKLVGAGGGGFLLFYAEDRNKLRRAFAHTGLQEARFRFDFEGTKVLLS